MPSNEMSLKDRPINNGKEDKMTSRFYESMSHSPKSHFMRHLGQGKVILFPISDM